MTQCFFFYFATHELCLFFIFCTKSVGRLCLFNNFINSILFGINVIFPFINLH